MKLFVCSSLLIVIIISCILVVSCSKGGGSTPPPPVNPCSGVTISVTGTVTDATGPGATNGSIAVSATGSSNFTFNLNGGTFQTSGTFSNLVKGTYTIVAKDSKGCTGTKQFTVDEANACAGVNIVVNFTSSAAIPCATPATGSVTVTATGSNGFTYSIDGGAFQVSNIFNAVAPGSHTMRVKDTNGCTGSATATVAAAAAGPLFTEVKTMMQNNCVSCHNATQSEGGMNWTVDCNIVANKDRIKARAVDGIPSPMPPTGLLPISERNKITNWINAGGNYSN
jgi:hypothetical protein